MAREEQDREDLLREATALVARAEFQIADGEPIVVGFRRDGSASVFFGADPVYQFTAANELRRAYRHGFLIKAEGGNLVRLERHRTAAAVELIRQEMALAERNLFLAELVDRLTFLREALVSGNYQLTGTVPADSDVIARVISWLTTMPLPPIVAKTARLSGKQS